MLEKSLVSVCINSYNSEKYIMQAINSVINQTYKNLQIIIVDDCSTDSTVDIIKSIKDDRIEFYQNPTNLHISSSYNVSLKYVKGEYVARLDPDDAWAIDKIEKQVSFLEQNKEYGACFTYVDTIDENGNAVIDSSVDFTEIFTFENRPHPDMYRQLFLNGNRLCHSSSLIRTDIVRKVGPYDISLVFLQDYDYWMRLLTFCNLYVLAENLTIYRCGGITSEMSNENWNSHNTEYLRISYKSLNMCPAQLFLDAFSDKLRLKGKKHTSEDVEIEKAFVLLDGTSVLEGNCILGINKFSELLKEKKYVECMNNNFNFTAKDFYKIQSSEVYAKPENNKNKIIIYYDYGEGYSETNKHIIDYNIITNDCEFLFPIPQGVKTVRIDPIDNEFCIIKNLRITANGEELDYSGNYIGVDESKEFLFFFTNDPQVWVNIGPDIKEIKISFNMFETDFKSSGSNNFEGIGEVIGMLGDNIISQKGIIDTQTAIIAQKDSMINDKNNLILQKDSIIHEKNNLILQKDSMIHEKNNLILQKDSTIDEKNNLILQKDAMIHDKNNLILQKDSMIHEKNVLIAHKEKIVAEKNAIIQNYNIEIANKNDVIESKNNIINELDKIVAENQEIIAQKDLAINIKDGIIADKDIAITNATRQNEELSLAYNDIVNSFYWKLTTLPRKATHKIKTIFGRNIQIMCFLVFVKGFLRGGVKEGKNRICNYKNAIDSIEYPIEISEEQRSIEEKTRFEQKIKFSILVPLYNTPIKYLEEMINSVRAQTYTNWELCLADGSDAEHSYVGDYCCQKSAIDNRIKYKKLTKNMGISENTNACMKMAKGDYIALFDHDDILHPSILFEYMQVITEKKADFIYCDEETFTDEEGEGFVSVLKHHKPEFSPDTLRSYNYICHFSCFTKKLQKMVGGFNKEYDGSQDYDLILRLTEKAKSIARVPKILYYWRSHPASVASSASAKPYVVDAAQKAIYAHLDRIGLKGTVRESYAPTTYKIDYEIIGNPLISIVIPNKDHIDDLDMCLRSIYTKSTYENFEIIVVENNSTQKETFNYYKEIQKKHDNIKVVYWKKKVFNYSAINNFGAKYANGEYILLLNNDIEVITPKWMEEMLMFAQRNDVGAVGSMLYYPDDTIQHAGVILGIGGVAGHSHKYFDRKSYGYVSRACISQNLSACTAACLLIKRSVFDEINGLDEGFAVAFNDVDLCMKIRDAGYLIVFTPYAEFYHYESKSRGLEDSPEKVARFNSEIERFMSKWSKELEQGDPYYNPNLTLIDEDFSLKEQITE